MLKTILGSDAENGKSRKEKTCRNDEAKRCREVDVSLCPIKRKGKRQSN